MALITRKSITVTGNSIISTETGEKVAVSMAANISQSTSMTTTIVDNELYEANKIQCRADVDEFTEYCRTIEDEEVSE